MPQVPDFVQRALRLIARSHRGCVRTQPPFPGPRHARTTVLGLLETQGNTNKKTGSTGTVSHWEGEAEGAENLREVMTSALWSPKTLFTVSCNHPNNVQVSPDDFLHLRDAETDARTA